MSLTIILSIIIIILIMAMVLNQKFMKDRVETEEYARNQLISKNSILSEENLSLKNQMLSTNNDVGQHAFKNAKRELSKILICKIKHTKISYEEIYDDRFFHSYFL